MGFLDLGYEYVVVDDCCMAITQGKKAQACPRLKACPLAHVVYAHVQVCIQLHIDSIYKYIGCQCVASINAPRIRHHIFPSVEHFDKYLRFSIIDDIGL